MIGRRAGRLVAAMAVGIAPLGTSLPNAFASDSYAPITHVIVVMQSGHSFDNYFGTRRGSTGSSSPPTFSPWPRG